MIYNLANAVCIVIGGLIGLFLKKGVPDKIKDALIKAMGLCVLSIGISLSLKGENTLLIVISIAVGTLIGEILDLDGKVNKLGAYLQSKFKGSENSRFGEGFVTASILFCAGAMGVVGSLEAGLTGSGDTLLAKGLIDGIISAIFAATLGLGVAFSSISVFIYQGIFVLLAGMISQYIGDPVIASVSSIGGITILGIGMNLVLDKNIKVANITPSVFIPMIVSIFGIV